MLKHSARLRSSEVREVLVRGRSTRGKLLSLKVLRAEGTFRCAVVVSKKVGRTAVVRNRLRRALYRALSESSLPHSGHAILFVLSVPPPPLAPAFTEELKKLLHV